MTGEVTSGPDVGRVVTVSVTAAGEARARELPYEHRAADGPGGTGLAACVAGLWPDVDGLVLVGATGIAVRAVAPLLAGKRADPAVVCLDDGGRWAVALTGGHRGANDLAREVGALVGAEPVVTTASDAAAGVAPLDALPGLDARGDVAGVTRAWLDGTPPALDRTDLPGWPLPEDVARLDGSGPGTPTGRRAGLPDGSGAPDAPGTPGSGPRVARPLVRLTDRSGPAGAGEVLLRPPSLVVGVGSSSGAPAAGIAALVERALTGAGLDPGAVGLVASVDLKATEPGIVALADRLGAELRTFPAEILAGVAVPHPSEVVDAAVGTPSVAEAAALTAGGPGARLVVSKQRTEDATVAVARRTRPEGHLAVVGLGPGGAAWRAPAAARAVRDAGVVVGYGPYVDLAGDLLGAHHEVVRSPIGAEADRCAAALERAAAGDRVALVCSGDAGVYAMASLVCELAPGRGNPPVTVVPGVTASLAAAALLGAPLGHDHASVSLSDLLTPWEAIERRLRAVAESDLVLSLYNPRSRRRTRQLERALQILGEHRPAGCPAAVAADVGRPGQRIVRTTLAELDPGEVDMLSLVIVGASTTRWLGGRMVTPRGYPARPAVAAP